MKTKARLAIILMILMAYLLNAYNATAANLQNAFKDTLTIAAINQAGYNGLSSNLDNRVSTVISFILSFVGIIFIFLIIYGGLKWMTAGGNDQALEKARETIRQSIIGLILIVSAYSISIFLFKSINK